MTDDLRSIAAAKVSRLQGMYLADSRASGRELAALRRSVSAGASEPEVWGLVFDDLPGRYTGARDTPSHAESALHAALCLYAFHQQSRATGMHRAGVGVGTAVAQLHRATGAESTVARFKAAGSATTMAETLHHLRGLITQFRSHDIPLDYARLTWDLYQLQRNETAAAVRRTWGRDLHRVPRPETDVDSDAADTAPTTENLGDPA